MDDRLLYSFAAPTPNGTFGDVFLRDLCGGEPELVLAAEHGIQAGTVLEFPQVGKVLYGFKGKNMYVVDRLDEPGADTPKPVAGFTFDGSQGVVKLIDRATAAETTQVPRTRSWSYDVDQALVLYTDFVDAEPGLWATPIPTP